MNNKGYYIIALCCALLFSGCAAKSKYYWGNYETVIYNNHITPEKATADVQIEQLNSDIQRAQDKGKLVPPGLYAHLGTMYASTGNNALAIEALEHEKQAFPESAVMVDGMINRLKKNNK